MSRLTDERLAEILRPKELVGETELELLAREVRDLRQSHSVACETCDSLRDTITKVRAETMELIRDRNELRAEVNRLRGVLSREIDTAELEKVVQLTHERDEARELLRRFRACGEFHRRALDGSTFHIYQQSFEDCCQFYDTKFGQTQHPEPSGEWVPWTAETRPSGMVIFREIGRRSWESPGRWRDDHVRIENWDIPWASLLSSWEWSGDGKTWQRCGVRK